MPTQPEAMIRAPANLRELVGAAFARARAAGDLHYYPTKVAVLRVGAIPFQLRFAPALASKPTARARDAAPAADPAAVPAADPAADPFADPPPGLRIADVGPEHYLVLNKFAVVAEHFILATRAFRPQTQVLAAADLAAAMACIRAYGDDDGGLFAFFNAGAHSGASQPHRHLQLLPVARMRDGLAGGGWDVLAARPAMLAQTPFAAFAEPVAADAPPADLHAAYLRLYARAAAAATGAAVPQAAAAGDEARISYNMSMTARALVVCPRLAEGGAVRLAAGAGRLALNGTVLAGAALVKSEAEWHALREDPRRLAKVLGEIGVPREAVVSLQA